MDEIGNYGEQHGYFQSEHEMLVFKAELVHLLWEQEAAFNSRGMVQCESRCT